MSVRPAKTQVSLGIRPVWSESLLCAQWVAKYPRFLHADSEDSDQIFTVCMKKALVLIYPFSAQRRLWSDWADSQADLSLRWAHTHSVGFVMSWLIWYQKHRAGLEFSIRLMLATFTPIQTIMIDMFIEKKMGLRIRYRHVNILTACSWTKAVRSL